MKLRFALGVFTERILDYVLSCRCQVVGNSEFFGGVMLSTILPAWLTTIFIWDRCRAPSSALAARASEGWPFCFILGMYRSHPVVVTGAAVGRLDEQNLRFSGRRLLLTAAGTS